MAIVKIRIDRMGKVDISLPEGQNLGKSCKGIVDQIQGALGSAVKMDANRDYSYEQPVDEVVTDHIR
jgi:hypothetical protein